MVDVEHVLIALRQNKPAEFFGVQVAVPHAHAAASGTTPSSFGQTCTAEHLLIDEVQKSPVVVVQAAAPQMHTSLLAVVPSVSEQRGPEAQTQVVEEEHLVIASVSVLKKRVSLLLTQPGG